MGFLARCVLVVAAYGSGCASNGSGTAQPAAPSHNAATALATPSPPSAPPPGPSSASAVLDASGLPRVKLGAALPADLAVAERYYTSFYADAQPLEGFRLATADVLVIVDGGAFEAFGMEHPGQPAPDDVRAQTLAAGAAGKLIVRMIVVTDPKVTTANGLRVGSGIATFRAEIPDPRLQRVPPLWEDPTCLVEAAGLAFFFDGCPHVDGEAPAKTAKVIRIVGRR